MLLILVARTRVLQIHAARRHVRQTRVVPILAVRDIILVGRGRAVQTPVLRIPRVRRETHVPPITPAGQGIHVLLIARVRRHRPIHVLLPTLVGHIIHAVRQIRVR